MMINVVLGVEIAECFLGVVVHTVIILVSIVLLPVIGEGQESRRSLAGSPSQFTAKDHASVLGVLLDDDLELSSEDDGTAFLAPLLLDFTHNGDDDVHKDKHNHQ